MTTHKVHWFSLEHCGLQLKNLQLSRIIENFHDADVGYARALHHHTAAALRLPF